MLKSYFKSPRLVEYPADWIYIMIIMFARSELVSSLVI